MAVVNYFLDQIPFKNYNVSVSNSSNLFDKPSFKEGLSKSWDNEHGYDIDLNNRYLEAKTITLDCFIPATSKIECITQYNNFLNVIDKKGSRRLSVLADTLRLEFQVFRVDSVEVNLTYDDTNKVGVFKLKLVENMPIKRVLKAINQTSTISINSTKVLVINWGDGTEQYTSPGNKTYTKTYTSFQAEKYYPLVLGDIDSITSFNTNCTIVWNKF